MMAIPRKIGMAVCLGAHWRGSVDHTQTYMKHGMSIAQADHFAAFHLCLGVADRNIRKHAGPREVATVVAEDAPEMRRFLKQIPRIMRDRPITLSKDDLRETISDKEAGFSQQKGDLRVTRIRNSIHFVDKSEDPLVQVADACAYGFRRFFAGEKFGPEFARAILGNENLLRNFGPPCGCACYWPQQSAFR